MDVQRFQLQQALRRHLSLDETLGIMTVLEPLFRMCTLNRFFYGNNSDLPEQIIESVATLSQHPYESIEGIALSVMPPRLLQGTQLSNFSLRIRRQSAPKIQNVVSYAHEKCLSIDICLSFGDRLLGVLPHNLWIQLWEIVRLWLLCEIGKPHLAREADAYKKVVQLCMRGSLPYDSKPKMPNTLLVIDALTAPSSTTRFYSRSLLRT